MKSRWILDCMALVSETPSPYNGTKTYVSTGAVDRDHINAKETEQVSYLGRPSRANLCAEPDDILFAKMCATEKTLRITPENSSFIYSTGFFAVRANSEIMIGDCLYHLLSSEQFLRQKDKNSSGATQKAITNAGLEKIKVVVPSLAEQHKLAKKLSLIDQLIALRKEEITVLDDIVKSRFIEMFGDPRSNSLKWPLVKLRECLVGIESGKSLNCENHSRTDDYPAVLKLSAITYGVYNPCENKQLPSDEMFVPEAEVHSGDLLFSRKNTYEYVGVSVYVENTPTKLMLPDLIFRLVPTADCCSRYLNQLINHPLYHSIISGLATGTTGSMPNISKQRLLDLAIPLPPVKEQHSIEPLLKQADKSKFEIQKSLEKLEILKKSLMQQYFS